MWIFAVSALFQLLRVALFVPRGNRRKNNNGLLAFSMFSQYRPYAGPDFWRWVEYALTSPLQIVVIASTLTVTDRSMLLALGALQGALTLLGIPIEQEMHELSLQRVRVAAERDKYTGRKKSHLTKVLLLLWSTWSLHGVIWWVLFERLARQENSLRECEGVDAEMPPVVNFIVFTEFFLFSCFGLVPCIQLGLTLRPATKNPAAWAWASKAYGVLSVSAKTALFGGFLWMIAAIPRPDG